jgi:hypothetical protein
MKRNFTLLAAALVCAAFVSCKDKTAEAETPAETPEAKTYAELEKANWFLGNWGSTSPEGELTERWQKVNDSVYKGECYFVVGGKDTVFSEAVDLVEEAGKLTYIVTVPGQNNEKPVPFVMTSGNDTQIIFENPAHDYPNKIVYNKITNDSILAEISGIQKGKPKSEQFPLKKQ